MELKSRKYALLNDYEWLKNKYEVEKLSTREITKLVGAKTSNSVRQALIRHKISVRSISDGLTCNREDDGFKIDESVLTGCLLGDAGLRAWNRESENSYPYFYKKNKYPDHVGFVGNILFQNRFVLPKPECRLINGKLCSYYCMRSLSNKDLLEWDRKWYPAKNNFVKLVPPDVKIDEIVLLHWFLDDGFSENRKRKYPEGWVQRKKQIRIGFCSESFSKDDNQMLCDKVNERFNLRFKIKPFDRGTGWRIQVPQSQAGLFFEIIGSPPVKNLAYKWK